jgi:hypothetical protein
MPFTVPAPTLTVSIVTYRPNLALLDTTLRKLSRAIGAATDEGALRAVNLVLIDNTGERAVADAVVKLGAAHFESSAVTMNYLHGHANIGYGAAHNLVMHGGNTHYHLVLNPDVELAPDALTVALRYLAEHPEIGVVVPAVFRPDGGREYLCKRYPSLLDLALRGFAPGPLRRVFRKRLDRYEMRDAVGDAVMSPVPVMSGSFLLARRKAIEVTGGFDPEFFLYFEDFDWSVRLNQVTQSAYLPDVRVVHHGGRAAAKGVRHVAYFARSAVRFFNKHGWKFA